jgi:hypothetical protein
MGAMGERLKLAAGKILTKKELALRTSLDMYLTRVHLHVMGYLPICGSVANESRRWQGLPKPPRLRDASRKQVCRKPRT